MARKPKAGPGNTADAEARAPALIPIRYRQPISRDLAHPVGAQQLSEVLAEVPPFAALSVSFSGVPTLWNETRPETPQPMEKAPQPILSAWFTHRRSAPSTGNAQPSSGEFGERWGLTVYPVPAGLKSTVRTALETTGLALIRDWLAEPRTAAWREAPRHEIEVLYDFEGGVLSWRETD